MNQNFSNLLKNNQSGLGCLLSFVLISFLLGSVGLGWLVNSFLIVIGLWLLLPILAWWGLNWWLKINLVEGECPVCSYNFTGFKGTECVCPNCQEPLKVAAKGFQRLTPPATIDVEAIEVSVSSDND